MKCIRFLVAAAAVAVAGVIMPAQAQFKFGLKAGVNVNALHFNKDILNSDNRAGFTGGAMVEFTAPVIGIGMDASVMYVRRSAEWMAENGLQKEHNDYIDIPVNLKWKMNIPVLNNIARPYLATGPAFSVLTSPRNWGDAYRNRKFDTSWNFGFGVEFFKHLQVGASYGIGLTKALKAIDVTQSGQVSGRNKYWTVTAAYLF